MKKRHLMSNSEVCEFIGTQDLRTWNSVNGYASHVDAQIKGVVARLDAVAPILYEYASGRASEHQDGDMEALHDAVKWSDAVTVTAAGWSMSRVTKFTRVGGGWVRKMHDVWHDR